MSEPTEYPIPLPVTPKMADRMRAAGWRPCTHDGDKIDECDFGGAGRRICMECGAVRQLVFVTREVTEWEPVGEWETA